MNPEESKLRVDPVQRKEKNTFSECAHVLGVLLLLRQKLLNLGPSEIRNLRTRWLRGSAVRTGRNETRLVLVEVKSQSRPSSGERRAEISQPAHPTVKLKLTNSRQPVITIRVKA